MSDWLALGVLALGLVLVGLGWRVGFWLADQRR